MQRAIEARFAEAQRKRAVLAGEAPAETVAMPTTPAPHPPDRLSQVDAELEALRRELGG